jgi:N-acetylglucosaminyldiphosphoundecaprenol N-acetyl-beta-D-mannosaminyltransferase
LVKRGRKVVWLIIGDGALRPALEERARERKIQSHVRFLGLRSPAEIANVLRGSDVYALSSAYEGMPMAMLEAMGCGLPVATTDVGEVRRVVTPGVNGAIAAQNSRAGLIDALEDVLDHLDEYRGAPAVKATKAYEPALVLQPIYDRYRELAEIARDRQVRSARDGVPAAPAAPAAPSSHAVEAPTFEGITAAPIGHAPAAYWHRRRLPVVGVPVDAVGAAQAREIILGWAKARESRYVCFCNVHSAVAYSGDPRHRLSLDKADLVAPDGAPIAWMLRRKGVLNQPRIDGPGTMWALCRDAAARGLKIGLYGSAPETLQALRKALLHALPSLQLTYCESPRFGKLTEEEDATVCRHIDAAGVQLLFVALGCPKQERWMAEHAGRVKAVMLGVGAAFDFHAGTMSRAPVWMQESGLEWLHRIGSEPQRLWKRYLFTNSVFMARGARELLSHRLRSKPVVINQRVKASASEPAGTGRITPDPTLHAWSRNLDQQSISELLARVDASMSLRTGRVIGFIASGAGEGTSTLASAYAQTAAAQMNRRVLLLTSQGDASQPVGVFEALASGHSMDLTITRRTGGFFGAALVGNGADQSAWALCRREELWSSLRDSFDEVVMDLTSSAVSRTGVMMSCYCDGVIVVVEAEKTRAPVAEALISSLLAVRANLLGTVMNKRRFHVPNALYRRL